MKKQVLKKIAIGLCLSFSFAALHIIISAPALAESDLTAPATEPGEMSRGIAFDGENFLVAIRGDQSHGGRIAAQLISKEGTPVSSRIDIGRSGWIPGVAFDGDNYLMIWEDGDSEPANLIYGQFIGKSGSLVGGPFPISTAPGAIDPACAISFNGTSYVVAWNDATAEGACGYVRFRSRHQGRRAWRRDDAQRRPRLLSVHIHGTGNLACRLEFGSSRRIEPCYRFFRFTHRAGNGNG